jgi:hypothetical protein
MYSWQSRCAPFLITYKVLHFSDGIALAHSTFSNSSIIRRLPAAAPRPAEAAAAAAFPAAAAAAAPYITFSRNISMALPSISF